MTSINTKVKDNTCFFFLVQVHIFMKRLSGHPKLLKKNIKPNLSKKLFFIYCRQPIFQMGIHQTLILFNISNEILILFRVNYILPTRNYGHFNIISPWFEKCHCTHMRLAPLCSCYPNQDKYVFYLFFSTFLFVVSKSHRGLKNVIVPT